VLPDRLAGRRIFFQYPGYKFFLSGGGQAITLRSTKGQVLILNDFLYLLAQSQKIFFLQNKRKPKEIKVCNIDVSDYSNRFNYDKRDLSKLEILLYF